MTDAVNEYLNMQSMLLRTRESLTSDEETDYLMELKELWVSMSREEKDYIKNYKGE